MNRLRLLAVALFIAAIVLRSQLLGAVAVMIGGATVVTGVWTWRVGKGLWIRRDGPTVLNWHEEREIGIILENRSLLPVPWLQLEESVPPAIRSANVAPVVLNLPAGGREVVRYPIRGSQRGWYRIGPLTLHTGDVLGFAATRRVIPTTELTVLPQVLPVIDLALPAALPFGPLANRQRRGEDPARPAGVRDYQASDGVRRIDWKASAHRNSLMVRRADPAITPETTFALAFRAEDYPARLLHNALERAATAVASLAVALLGRKLPVGLVSNGWDPKHGQAGIAIPVGKGDAQRNQVLAALGRLEAGQGPSLWSMLATQSLPWGGTLMLVLADLTLEELPQVLHCVRRGQQVAVLLLEPTPTGLALAQRYHLGYWLVDSRGAPRRA